MKKSRSTKLLAIVLALTICMSSFGAVTASASSIYPIFSSDDPIGVIFSDIIDTLLRFILDMFSGLFGNGPGFVNPDDETTQELIASNYYQGTGNQFATSAADGAQWHLGYANTSLIPEDYDNGSYYIGGYIAPENGFTNVVEGIATIPGIGQDDMKVRCVSISDGADRDGDGELDATVLFATIDCIGITNADIKDIRALLADYAAANNIVAINISSSHCHSAIDTEGLWTKMLSKLAYNGLQSGFETGEELQTGTNPQYMEFLKNKVADALIASHVDMKPGTLTYAVKELDQEYFQNKNRPTSGQIIDFDENGNVISDGERKIALSQIHRFLFTPDDTAYDPTMMINIAAHPDVAGLPTESNSGREISGDYVFYIGKYLEDAGYNFMFFQGAIAGIYMARGETGDNVETQQRVEESQRYGYEIARIALSLTKTEEEILADPVINSNADEIAENTQLVDIYDEDGNLIPEFDQFGFSFIDYVTYVISGGEFDVTIHRAETFTVEADLEAYTLYVKNGKHVVSEHVYDDTHTIVLDSINGINKVYNEDGDVVDVFITNPNVVSAKNEDGSKFEITLDGVSYGEFDLTDLTVKTNYKTLLMSSEGKIYENNQIPVNPGYTVWYEDWTPVEEVEVEPFLNLYITQVEIHISNALIETVGKLNMANYVVLVNEDGSYSTITEVGYMEIGQAYKTVMLPGEICQDLIAPNGASLLPQNSVTARPFNAPTACSLFGNDVACMGLMNDAIGYVVPDNDYTMGDPANHYHELISLGNTVASELMFGLEALRNEIVYY